MSRILLRHWVVAFLLVNLCPVLDRVIAQDLVDDFESGLKQGWEATGDAFEQPVVRAADLQISGHRGRYILNTFGSGDQATGQVSRSISLDRPYLNFLISGGSHPRQAYVSLTVDGQMVETATGNNSGTMRWVGWDVRQWQGKTAEFTIVDQATESWGHLNVDQIELSDRRRSGTGLWRLTDYRNSADYYRESHRPGFHFTPELNWMNDPNGLVFHEGKFHLFYQYNPLANDWGHMSWGHAISEDLFHWNHLPIAIRDQFQEMAFSGSAVVDHNNLSQLGSSQNPPLIAIYTGHGDGRQTQNLAISNDNGLTWQRFDGNPVLDLGKADFRDPKVFWYAPDQRWIMVVSLAVEKKIQIYASKNLKQWQYLSEFGPAGSEGKLNWECPDLFPLKVVGEEETRWILEVDMGSGAIAGGSGGEYFVGQFDGKTFRADSQQSQWVDHGRDFYAPISWNNVPEEDGRRIWIGWMNNWETCLVPTYPWRSAMSIPRQLSLRRFDGDLRLCQQPVDEIRSLRGEPISLNLPRTESATEEPPVGKQWDMEVTLIPGGAESCGVRVLKSGDQYTEIGYDSSKQCVYLDRTRSGNTGFHPAFAGRHEFPFEGDQELNLRIVVDQSSVEVFVDQGQGVLTDLVFPGEQADQVSLFGSDDRAVVRATLYPVRSVWTPPKR